MIAYAELAVATNFSFLRGASTAEELILRAKELGLVGMGIADRNSVAGVVRAHAMAKVIGFKIAVGARLVFSDGTPDILAYPEDRAAWGRLTRLLTVGKDRAEKGDCILGLPDLLEEMEGLNLIVMPPERIHSDALVNVLRRIKEKSRRSVWLGASFLYRGDDRRRLAKLRDATDSALVPLIAVNDVLYHVPERRVLQDVVTCIREHRTLEDAGRLLAANAERYLKSAEEMSRIFGATSKAIGQTTRFLKRCRFSLDDLKPHRYPSEFRKGYGTALEALIALTKEGAERRYPNGVPAHVQETLKHELEVIEDLKCAAYFLTVHDIVRFSESKGILCQGRGSAANSLVCYCLGITAVSPERVNGGLLFERFMSVERREPPDIDVDFEHERREEVIQHVYQHYRERHTALTATV